MKKIVLSLILALSMSVAVSVSADDTTKTEATATPAATETVQPSASPEVTAEPTAVPEASKAPEAEPSALPEVAPDASEPSPSASPETSAEPTTTPSPVPTEEPTGNFIALFNGSTSVIRNDGKDKLIIAEAKSSNGTINKVFINEAGRTMVPFRYLAEELLGLSDYSDENNNEYFKFDGGAIVIKYNGTEFMKAQNTPFTMEDKEDAEKFIIENINGSLYFPLRVLESVFGVYVKWDSQTGSIIFATNETTASEYAKESEENKFDFCDEYDKLYTYNFYNNPMNYSDIYLSSTGKKESVNKQVESENESKAFYYGATRILDTLYFTDEYGNICTMKENSKIPEVIVPVEENAHYADYIMAVKHGELYGIGANVSGGYMGKLYKYTLAADGTWSKNQFVTTSNEISNPIYWNGDIYYIVNNSGIYKKSISGNQEEICLLEKSDISFFAVNNDYIAVVDLEGKLICYNRAENCSEETAKQYGENSNFISLALYESYEGNVKKNVIYAVTAGNEENGIKNNLLEINAENMETVLKQSFTDMPIKRLALIEGHPYAIVNGNVTDLIV